MKYSFLELFLRLNLECNHVRCSINFEEQIEVSINSRVKLKNESTQILWTKASQN